MFPFLGCLRIEVLFELQPCLGPSLFATFREMEFPTYRVSVAASGIVSLVFKSYLGECGLDPNVVSESNDISYLVFTCRDSANAPTCNPTDVVA